MSFVENAGQWDSPARYVAEVGEYRARFEPGAVWLQGTGADRTTGRETRVVLAFELPPTQSIEAAERQPGIRNYFIGQDPGGWITHVSAFASLTYHGVVPGVDLVFREGETGLAYDLHVAPGADERALSLTVRGADGLSVDASGELVIETPIGAMRHTAPRAWEELGGGARRMVASEFRLLGENRFGLVAPGRDASRGLVIDPGMIWGSFLGGPGLNRPEGMDVGPDGDVYVTGWTDGQGFPTTPGAFDTQGGSPFGNWDAFVTRFESDGATLVYSSFLGQSNHLDQGKGVAVDSLGRAVVAGYTESFGFPLTAGALDTTQQGAECFVTMFTANGAGLRYSTYLGGAGSDIANSVAVDDQGNALVVGNTKSTDFPTTSGAYQAALAGGADGFAAIIGSDGTYLVGSTLFGGSGDDSIWDVVWDATSGIAIGGQTRSLDFPISPGAIKTAITFGAESAFVARLKSVGGPLIYSTYMNDSGIAGVLGLDLDSFGRVAVAAGTQTPSYPVTPGAYDTTFGSPASGVLSLLEPDGTNFVYSTYFHGSGAFDSGGVYAVSLSSGVATFAGQADGTIPTTPGAYQHPASGTGAVLRMHPSGSKLMYGSGLGIPPMVDVVPTPSHAFALAGTGWGWGFTPTAGAYDTTFNGDEDVAVAVMDLLPTGVSRFGASSPACLGPIWADVGSMPWAGNAQFSITCEGAPPGGLGAVGVGVQPLPSGIGVLGATLYLAQTALIAPASADAYGWSETLLPLAPSLPVGVKAYAQYAWLNPPGCGAPGLLSASDALELEIQPTVP